MTALRVSACAIALAVGGGIMALWPSSASAREARCPLGYTYRGTHVTDDEIIVDCQMTVDPSLPPCDQVPASVAAMESEARGLRRELQDNSREAARIGSALDEWASLHQKARDEAQANAIKVAKDLARDRAVEYLRSTARLHYELNVQEAGLLRREWAAILSRLSSMSPSVKAYHLSRIANAKTFEQGVKVLDEGIDAINASEATGEAVIEPTRDNRLGAMAETLELIEKLTYSNPYTGLLIKDFKSVSNATYGWWAALAARNRLKQFTALDDALLAEAIRESNRYVALRVAITAAHRGEGYCRPLVG